MIPIENKFLLSNLIAWSIGMASLGVISLGSFQTGVILLAGLFFYGKRISLILFLSGKKKNLGWFR